VLRLVLELDGDVLSWSFSVVGLEAALDQVVPAQCGLFGVFGDLGWEELDAHVRPTADDLEDLRDRLAFYVPTDRLSIGQVVDDAGLDALALFRRLSAPGYRLSATL